MAGKSNSKKKKPIYFVLLLLFLLSSLWRKLFVWPQYVYIVNMCTYVRLCRVNSIRTHTYAKRTRTDFEQKQFGPRRVFIIHNSSAANYFRSILTSIENFLPAHYSLRRVKYGTRDCVGTRLDCGKTNIKIYLRAF